MHVTEEKLWTREFISISIVNFVLMLSMYLLLVMMANYAILAYDVSTSKAGLVASIFIIGALFGRLYTGKKIEEYGAKRMLLVGISIFVTMCVFYFLPISIDTLTIIRFLQGIGVGMGTTATGTIVAQIIPRSRMGEGISYFSISIILSTATGPLIGVWLLNHYTYSSIFIFSLTMGMISLLLATATKLPKTEVKKEKGSKNKRIFQLGDYFEPRAVPIAIITFVIVFAYSGILSFITAYAAEINLVKAGGFYFFVYAMTMLFTRPITGKIMDRRGANSVAYPTILLFAIGMIVLSQAHSSFTFLLAAALIGLGYGNFQSITQALAMKVTPVERAGLANSTYFIFLDLALGLGPLLLGYFISLFSFRGMYLSLTVIIVFGFFVYHLLHGRKDKEITEKYMDTMTS